MTEKPTSLGDLLDAIVHEEPRPTYEALTRWQARYPEHRAELASFFATWAVQEELPEELEPRIDEARVAERVRAHALALLNAPAARLAAIIRGAGLTEDEVGARCDLDVTLLAKLDRRLIHLGTIPVRLLERLGAAIGKSVDEVRSMLDGPPLGLASATYKSRVRPEPFAQDFAAAVRASTLPEDAKRAWLDLVSKEGGPG